MAGRRADRERVHECNLVTMSLTMFVNIFATVIVNVFVSLSESLRPL